MMRQLLLSLLFVSLAASSLSAQGITFFEGSYEEALVVAQEQNKLVFVDAYAVWCGPCRRMSSDVFPREDVGAYFNENFISLKIDMEKEAGIAFGKHFPVSSYPTLLFIASNGELVQRVIGAQAPDVLIGQAQAAIRKADNSESFAERYREGEREPAFMLNYVRSLHKAGKPSLAVANEWLRDQKDFSNPDVLAVIYESCVQADSRIFKLFTEHRKALEGQFGATAVADRIERACAKTMQSALTYQSEPLMLEAREAMKEHLPSRARAFEAHADFAVAKQKKDPALAYAAARKVTAAEGNGAAINYTMANELSRYFAHAPKAMQLASKMAGLAAKSDQQFEYVYTYARLLLATGKTKQAKQQIIKAKDGKGIADDPRRSALLAELLQQIEG